MLIGSSVYSFFTAIQFLFLRIHHTSFLLLWVLATWVGGSHCSNVVTWTLPYCLLVPNEQEFLQGINLGVECLMLGHTQLWIMNSCLPKCLCQFPLPQAAYRVSITPQSCLPLLLSHLFKKFISEYVRNYFFISY